MPTIKTITEGARGCGFRKGGGLYLRFDGEPRACYRLPLAFEACPHCGNKINFSRAPSWISGKAFRSDDYEKRPRCSACFAGNIENIEKLLLVWVGQGYYKTPAAFLKEAKRQGISRRLINGVPRGFVVGETLVALAHLNAKTEIVENEEGALEPVPIAGAFAFFIPERIEYVVNTDDEGNVTDDDDKLERMERQGITLVRVIKQQPPEQKDIFSEN